MKAWAPVLVGLVALLVHAPARQGEFLWYDDTRFVLLNPHLDELSNAGRFFTDPDTATGPEGKTVTIYRPLRTLSYSVLVNLHGREDAAPFHTLSILVHALTAALLVLLARRAGLGPWTAAAGALVWALHPVTVEATAWISSLGDCWCGLFSVLAVLLYAADRRLPALAALAAALLAKEHAVVVPGLWLAWDLFLRPERLRRGEAALTAVRGAVPGLVVVLLFLVLGGRIGVTMNQLDEPLGGSHGAAVLTMLAGLGWYAATILFPYGSTFNARVPTPDGVMSAPVLLGALVLGALVAGTVRGPRRTRLACGWFLLALVPVSNVLVPLKIPTADRFLYLPLMGAAFAAGEVAERLKGRALWAAPAVLVVLAALTLDRTGDWRDDTALVEAGRRVNPKDKMILWAEAAHKAQRAAESFLVNEPARAAALATEAADLYRKYLAAATPVEQAEVWVELGDLNYAAGQWALQHADNPDQVRDFWSRAMDAFYEARAFQVRGVGRVTEHAVRHTAERLVELGVALADLENRNLGRTIGTALEAAAFLKQRYGVDDRYDRARLILAGAIRVRASAPEQAKAALDEVLALVDSLRKDGALGTSYVRAQAVFFRSILGGRGSLARPGLEEAYELYLEAAREQPSVRLQALVYAGRCALTISRQFREDACLARAQAVLESVPEVARRDGLRPTARLAGEQQRLLADVEDAR